MSHTLKNNPAKRRRRDDSTSALLRPFKSPLRRDVHQGNNNTTSTRDDGSAVVSDASSSTKPIMPNLGASKSSLTTSTASKKPRTSYYTNSSRTNGSGGDNPIEPDDAEITALKRKRLTLQSQLATLRSELDTAQQALRIESSTRDDELKTLTVKWRMVSQKAADELFDAAKDKIERMGGVAAWKEKERERVRRSLMWEDENFYGGEEFDDDVDRDRAAVSNDAPAKSRCVKNETREEEEGEGEETFTMDMMLKSLNIDLDIMGFDDIEQKWKSN